MTKLHHALFGSVILLLTIATPIVAEELLISTGEFAPLYSEKVTHFGLIPDIVTEAFDAVGVKVKFKSYP